MNLRRSFDDFNPSRFFVFSLLFLFVILFCLRSDQLIQWSYCVVFFPLWIWKLTVLLGFIVGVVVWCRHPLYRIDSHVQFKAMILSAVCQMVLFIFEILVCYNLETKQNQWIFVFLPLLVLSIVGIAICIWALKNGRSFELELVCAVNILFFVFVALKLDYRIDWSWAVVFIPLWIVMSVVIVMELYGLILAVILCKSPELMPEQRRHTLSVTLGYACVVFPLLVFEILLVQQLDHHINTKFIAISTPLLLALLVLVLMAFKIRAGSGNPWWFGIRKSLCQLLLEVCPLLQEYGNISYRVRSIGHVATPSDTQTSPHSRSDGERGGDESVNVVIVSPGEGGDKSQSSIKFVKKPSIPNPPLHSIVVEMPD